MAKLSESQKIENKSRDTGMAMVLLLLIVYLAAGRLPWVLYAAIALHVVNMTKPRLFKPLSVVWFGFSEILGAVMSKVIMALVFFGVVTPMGLWRRMAGKDSLKLRSFKGSGESVMWERNHVFTAADLERPY